MAKFQVNRLAASWITVMVATPFCIVTTYELYQRIFLGKEAKKPISLPNVKKPE
ncbi:hypothetical protein CONCODRAFT_79195 [Conidiobolus coronatus NRRL 28638]|uniref:Uncharacterized protein n=1 Tax=Conidiobolus coronatus (strain ATCC 28846 / CBS 209.66 / NRRL 28638) TaxID=796925 RepID=A0A137P3V3_CONC2|nr:hypothetical protein CONCODRAFT_79195 [Conidiobolus coronatus NRRL 28638]|eukprot:KXN69693.1 hypothetical protein CONCODRAFT_79195 [Conidiobolus coronatus NRRL 28638]